MKFSLRSLLEVVPFWYTPKCFPDQRERLTANPLDTRSDRIAPGFILPVAESTSTSISTSEPSPTPPLPPPPPPPPSPPPLSPSPSLLPQPPVTVAVTSISTSLITTTIDVTVNRTYYVTDTETFTRTIPTTPLTKTIANGTVTVTPVSAVADVKKPVSASEVLAIISGVVNLALLIAMFFLVRRFYRMYRQERVLRKQLQTEGVELT